MFKKKICEALARACGALLFLLLTALVVLVAAVFFVGFGAAVSAVFDLCGL